VEGRKLAAFDSVKTIFSRHTVSARDFDYGPPRIDARRHLRCTFEFTEQFG
jgi:hypothetical protein